VLGQVSCNITYNNNTNNNIYEDVLNDNILRTTTNKGSSRLPKKKINLFYITFNMCMATKFNNINVILVCEDNHDHKL